MALYFLSDISSRLDLESSKHLEQEINPFIKFEGAAGDQMSVDQIIEYPRMDDPTKKERVHWEFQESGDILFTRRTAVHMQYINSNFDIPVTTMAIIHNAKPSFKDHYKIGSKDNGIDFKFEYYDVSKRKESEFQEKPDSLIAQVMYSIWLSGRSRMKREEKFEKFKLIIKRINDLHLTVNDHGISLLFVLKNIFFCCKSNAEFLNFVRENNYLIYKDRVMNIFEETGLMFKNEGKEEGRKEGREEERKKVIISMLKEKLGIEKIAKLTETTVEYVKSISAVC